MDLDHTNAAPFLAQAELLPLWQTGAGAALLSLPDCLADRQQQIPPLSLLGSPGLSRRPFDHYWFGAFARVDDIHGAAFGDSPLVKTRNNFTAWFAIVVRRFENYGGSRELTCAPCSAAPAAVKI